MASISPVRLVHPCFPTGLRFCTHLPASSYFAIPAIANNDGRFRPLLRPRRGARFIRIALSRLSKHLAIARAVAPAAVRAAAHCAAQANARPHTCEGCPADTSKMKHPGGATPARLGRRSMTLACRFRPARPICRISVTRNPCKPGVSGRRLRSRRYRSQFGTFSKCVVEMTGAADRTPRINAETFSPARVGTPVRRKN